MQKVLDGITVIEQGTFITGPAAGMLLADLGAKVIKVEQPQTGDPFRAFKGELYSRTTKPTTVTNTASRSTQKMKMTSRYLMNSSNPRMYTFKTFVQVRPIGWGLVGIDLRS